MSSPEIALLLELVLDLKKDLSSMRTEIDKNTVTLDTHEKRSTSSEKRLDRLEKRDQMLNGFVKISIGVLGVAGSIIAIIEAIRHL